jgi:hypothetical protein
MEKKMGRIYITHCSRKKDDSLRGTGKTKTPDKLYTAIFIQRLVNRCRLVETEWAIFSDKYGVVFPDREIPWYDKSPSKVIANEYKILLDDFIDKLSSYQEIMFYHMPTRFHHLYKRLVKDAREKGLPVTLFSHIDQVR